MCGFNNIYEPLFFFLLIHVTSDAVFHLGSDGSLRKADVRDFKILRLYGCIQMYINLQILSVFSSLFEEQFTVRMEKI